MGTLSSDDFYKIYNNLPKVSDKLKKISNNFLKYSNDREILKIPNVTIKEGDVVTFICSPKISYKLKKIKIFHLSNTVIELNETDMTKMILLINRKLKLNKLFK